MMLTRLDTGMDIQVALKVSRTLIFINNIVLQNTLIIKQTGQVDVNRDARIEQQKKILAIKF